MDRTKLFETLQQRGYLYQMTNETEVKKIINGEPTTVYVGIDPTADSLHIGHCFPLIVLKYFQEAGHRVIVLFGGATAMIGDPSGKNDMRKMVSKEFIDNNLKQLKKIVGKFLKLDGDNPVIFVNNADWYKGYDYIDFMRDIGVHFNVNKMLASDACKTRLEQGGLTFLEMGYMLMQAYDFVYLNRKFSCKMELGGSDQWANILAGADLGRKLNHAEGKDEEAFQACTFPLLTNSEGQKMGKTVNGALWVDKEKESVFNFYQYFYNIDDKEVERLFKLLTRVDIDEIKFIMSGDIRQAKRQLAFEITKLVHGEQEASMAQEQAINLFAGDTSNAPTVQIDKGLVLQGINITALCELTKITVTRSEARRMIEQGAISFNDNKVSDFNLIVKECDFKDGFIILKKGKKTIIKVELA